MNSSLKVLIASDNCSVKMGGEAILPYHYFRLLRQRGHEAWLLVHGRNQPELEQLFPAEKDRITYVHNTWWQRNLYRWGQKLPHRLAEVTLFFLVYLISTVRLRQAARKLVKQHGITVVHQPMPVSPKEPSGFYGLKVPVIIGPMNGGMEFPPGFKNPISKVEQTAYKVGRALSGLMNRLIPGKIRAALLLYTNQRTLEALPPATKKVPRRELIENGVDLDLWKPLPVPAGAAGSDPAAPVEFTYLGRLVDWKGLSYLLKAVKALDSGLKVKLNIVGSGPDQARLQTETALLGLTDRVIFHGFVPQTEVPALMARTRALVLPSIYECGGAVVLEAMASQKAVIATNWGGPMDYLNADCGILVDPVNPEVFVAGLAQAMTTLARDPALASRMGQAGRRRIEEHFTWKDKMDTMLAIYAEVAGQAKTR